MREGALPILKKVVGQELKISCNSDLEEKIICKPTYRNKAYSFTSKLSSERMWTEDSGLVIR